MCDARFHIDFFISFNLQNIESVNSLMYTNDTYAAMYTTGEALIRVLRTLHVHMYIVANCYA